MASTRMKVYSFKAHEADYREWAWRALLEKVTFGEWVRRRLNASVDAVVAPTLAAVKEAKVAPIVCEHRLPRGAWCKTCRAIRK